MSAKFEHFFLTNLVWLTATQTYFYKCMKCIYTVFEKNGTFFNFRDSKPPMGTPHLQFHNESYKSF